MKTTNFITTLATFSLVLFLSAASIGNSTVSNGLTNTNDKSLAISNASETSNTYLRFDVVKYFDGHENRVTEMPVSNEFEYLRFDATVYTNENEVTELPVADDFEYLRFDVNNFLHEGEVTDLPVTSDFGYLRFDANNFAVPATADIDKLTENE
jgi:hypothetical protein